MKFVISLPNKHVFSFLAIVLFLLGGVTACKKGKNDPFLSLKTRDSRLSGTWELVSMEIAEKGFEVYNGTESSYDYTVSFKDSVYIMEYTHTYEYNGNTEANVQGDTISPFLYTINIEKDGRMQTVYDSQDQSADQTGTWHWGDTGKKKSILFLGYNTFYLDRLTNDEMILTIDGSLKGTNEEDKYIIDYSNIQIYKKIK